MAQGLRSLLARAGYELTRVPGPPAAAPELPPDLDAGAVALWKRVSPYTLTSPERVVALRDAVRYVVRADIPGAFVECGVWRGGSMQAVALTLMDLDVADRELFLFDTFDVMPRPGDRDLDLWGRPALDDWELVARHGVEAASPAYRPLPLDEVEAALVATGYPGERLHFVVGMVEDTLPDTAPDRIAVLRLDTDWYASTRHELQHLFARVSPGGVVIIDDYGHFQGARQAVDEYLQEHDLAVYLHRIDYSGRLLLVPPAGLDQNR